MSLVNIRIDLEFDLDESDLEALFKLFGGHTCDRPCDSWCEAYSGCINERPIRGELTP